MNKKVALKLIFFILGIVLIFHFLIFTELIPYDKVWSGKLNTVEEMNSIELFSILLNSFMLIIFFVKYKQLKKEKETKIIDILIWIFAIFFAFNTVGNLFAKSMTELILGTFFSLTLAILCFFIVKKKKTKAQQRV
jgi:hypothetical protein